MNTEHVKVIRKRHGLIGIDFSELWRYRELFWFLALRNILVRYKQTVIGIAWSILQPLFTMVVFSVIFGRLAKLPSEGVPYPILTFAALLPWQFFAHSMRSSSQSIVGSASIISKVYFPRLIIPTSAVISGTIDFCISLRRGRNKWVQPKLLRQLPTLPMSACPFNRRRPPTKGTDKKERINADFLFGHVGRKKELFCLRMSA